MVAGAEKCRVDVSDYILDCAGFGDRRENISALDTFDNTILDFVFDARANARANGCARARTRTTNRTRGCSIRALIRALIRITRRGSAGAKGAGGFRGEGQYPVMDFILVYQRIPNLIIICKIQLRMR